MKDIDFLPAKYYEATAKRKTQAWRVVVVAIFFGLLAAAAVGQYGVRLSAEHELSVVRQHYESARAQSMKLSELEQSLKPCQAEAELWTYLRHPWPRTRILQSLLVPLPDSIILNKIAMESEKLPVSPEAQPAPAPAAGGKPAVDKSSPAERDLRRLREETDSRQTVILLEGTTRESLALYSYLGALASEPIFSRAEVTSVESVDKAHPDTMLFRARLVVRPGYGQRGGPAPASAAASPQASAAAPHRVAMEAAR